MIVGGYLSVIYRQRQNFMRERLQNLDIGVTDYPILLILGHCEGLGCNEISKKYFINKSLVSKSISKLITLGYLEQRKDPDHKQRLNTYLTPRGRKVIPEIRSYSREWEDEFMGGLTSEEREVLKKLLSKIYERSLDYLD